MRPKLKFCFVCGRRYYHLGIVCARCPKPKRPYPKRAPIQRATGRTEVFERDVA